MLFAAPPGYVPRCSTAAGPVPSPPCPKCLCVLVHATSRGVTIAPPPGGGSPDPSSTITPGGCRGSAWRRQRRRPAARGARRGPARTTKTHHPTAPLRTPPRASAHAPPRPLPGAGRSPYQPHECQLAIPPPRGEGEQRTDQICALAIKQLTTAGGPHAGARSSFQGVPDGQQRDARAPAAAPTAARRTPATTDRQYRHPLADERTQPENSSRSSRAAD